MDDWKGLIDAAMQQETSDIIRAHGTYGQAVQAALAQAQMLLGDVEAAQIIEALYGALVAYSQQVMLECARRTHRLVASIMPSEQGKPTASRAC